MAGVRKKPRTKGGTFQGWFNDVAGKRRYFSGTRDRAETLRMAQRLEDDHRQVRLGYRPAPTSADRFSQRQFAEARDEYLGWGRAQGGRGGRGWSVIHSRTQETKLRWWQDQLGLSTLSDLPGILPRVEKALRELQTSGLTGKTLTNYVGPLGAFCNWCVQRGYLEADPIAAIAPFDTTPQTKRRAMTPEEIARLLEVSPPGRRLLYEVAFLTGLRVNELRSLTTAHLDVEHSGLQLDAEWTKNRKPGFQPLPEALTNRLREYIASGETARLYADAFGEGVPNAPSDPLLYVPSHPARVMGRDLGVAGIQKHESSGKLDFQACRVAYINLIIESGVNVKEAQELARHSTPQLTMNVYGRTRPERLHQAVERASKSVLSEPNRAPSVHRLAVGAEPENATPLSTRGCVSELMVAVEGIEPPTRGL
jgi:integrase